MSKAQENATAHSVLFELDDDVRHLSHLFDLLVEEIIEVNRSQLDDEAIKRLDRATAVACIGSNFVAKMMADVAKVI
jgi:hypothetical protein